MSKETVRFNKYCAELADVSRREADRMIQEGQVRLNGDIETNPATRVNPKIDMVEFVIDLVKHKADKVYIALNKPRGYVCSTSSEEGSPVLTLLKSVKNKITWIGRLDKDSTGLLLFTDDSSLPSKLIGEKSNCEKEYIVKVDRPLTEGALDKMREGIFLWGIKTKPAIIDKVDITSFRIVLTEGKNRQIRRMCQKVGYRVRSLKRVRVHKVKLADLESGKWRYLNEYEKKELLKLK